MTITVAPLTDIAVVQDAADTVVNLFNTFDDPRTTGKVARFELYDTSLAGGVTNVVLFDQARAGAPKTVQNFQTYVTDGDYANSIIHRSIPGFVVQGGGFTLDSNIERVPVDAPVQNEFSASRSNVRGTIAMAKQGNDPNSATSQWFFNLADNSANLDNQNGGFTVFGQVLSATDMAAVDAIAALPTGDASSISSAFTHLPTLSSDNTLTRDEFVRYRNISIEQRPELTFQIVGNSNPGLVDAAITGGQLVLDYQANQSGVAEVTIRATNLFGVTRDDTVLVSVGVGNSPIGSPLFEPDLDVVVEPVPSSGTGGSAEVGQGTDRGVLLLAVQGSSQADNLPGNAADNIIDGQGGNDVILGLDGDDQLTGGGGRDRLLGGNGNDDMDGGSGSDRVNGGKGNDAMNGGGGNDRLNGGSGNDAMNGGGGNDRLNGGRGRDIVDGGKGRNRLTGGRSRDTFILRRGKGQDLVRDFEDGKDRLRPRGFSFRAVTAEQRGKHTVLSVGNDAIAVLNNTDVADITAADFA